MNASIWKVSGITPGGEKFKVGAVFCNPGEEEISAQKVLVKSFFKELQSSETGSHLFQKVRYVEWVSNSFTSELDVVIKPFDEKGQK